MYVREYVYTFVCVSMCTRECRYDHGNGKKLITVISALIIEVATNENQTQWLTYSGQILSLPFKKYKDRISLSMIMQKPHNK